MCHWFLTYFPNSTEMLFELEVTYSIGLTLCLFLSVPLTLWFLLSTMFLQIINSGGLKVVWAASMKLIDGSLTVFVPYKCGKFCSDTVKGEKMGTSILPNFDLQKSIDIYCLAFSKGSVFRGFNIYRLCVWYVWFTYYHWRGLIKNEILLINYVYN